MFQSLFERRQEAVCNPTQRAEIEAIEVKQFEVQMIAKRMRQVNKDLNDAHVKKLKLDNKMAQSKKSQTMEKSRRDALRSVPKAIKKENQDKPVQNPFDEDTERFLQLIFPPEVVRPDENNQIAHLRTEAEMLAQEANESQAILPDTQSQPKKETDPFEDFDLAVKEWEEKMKKQQQYPQQ